MFSLKEDKTKLMAMIWPSTDCRINLFLHMASNKVQKHFLVFRVNYAACGIRIF